MTEVSELAKRIFIHDSISKHFSEKRFTRRLEQRRKTAVFRFALALVKQRQKALSTQDIETELMRYRLAYTLHRIASEHMTSDGNTQREELLKMTEAIIQCGTCA